MKKLISVILALIVTVSMFAGCNLNTPADSGKLKIVATIFPLYDWACAVADNTDAQVELLLDNGVDMHSFQPPAKDIIDISDCDLFLYVGGESDEWIDDVLEQAGNDDMIALNCINILGNQAKEEELIEGMQTEDEEDSAYDEHVWLSLKNAALFTEEICAALSQLDEENADRYRVNATEYTYLLNDLDAEYQTAVDNAAVKTLLVADRFPFRYLTDDYDLSYYAAFPGCSAETEASFTTILFLANKVDELKLKTILQTEGSDGSIPKTIKENTADKNQQILTLDSLQNITRKRIDAGESYLSIMQSNLNVLKQALT